MKKIKISHDLRFHKYMIMALGVVFFAIIFNDEGLGYELIFPFSIIIPYYFFHKSKNISYDTENLNLFIEKNSNAIPSHKIMEISILYFYLNREHVWKLYYFDENDKLKNIRFVPVIHTFEQYKKVLLQNNKRVIINEHFQSNRIW
jgi:hypothetical protein